MRGIAAAFILSFCLIVAGVVGSILYTTTAINGNNHQWCSSLEQLTKTKPPAPAPGNPSRIFAYHLYQSFKFLEGQFKC